MNERGLARHGANVTSQDGEDGILQFIFSRIGTTSRVCVEFGAWDGKHLSNVWNLWTNEGWRAYLIEGSVAKHRELVEATRGKSVHAICAYVADAGESSLDALLERAGAPDSPDLVSIDIDGNDYAVWRSIARYRARVVVVEHNPTIPPHIDFVTVGPNYVGSSARALVELGRTLGYELAACTMTNCVFVQRDLYDLLGLESNDLNELFDGRHLCWAMSSYSGELFLSRRPPYMPGTTPPGFDSTRQTLLSQLFRMGRQLLWRQPGESFGASRQRLRGPSPDLLSILAEEQGAST